jgi:hypothetical protein
MTETLSEDYSDSTIEFQDFVKALRDQDLQCVIIEGKESDNESHLKVVNFRNPKGKLYSVHFENERLPTDSEYFSILKEIIG